MQTGCYEDNTRRSSGCGGQFQFKRVLSRRANETATQGGMKQVAVHVFAKDRVEESSKISSCEVEHVIWSRENCMQSCYEKRS